MRYGIVVGRFQVPELHPGHINMLTSVYKKFDKVVVFLATSRAYPTGKNPLGVEPRREMILTEFSDVSTPVSKQPATDLGKASKRGRLALLYDGNGRYHTAENIGPNGEYGNQLETVFLDGEIMAYQNLKEIRKLAEV